jgi:hypothetical protein
MQPALLRGHRGAQAAPARRARGRGAVARRTRVPACAARASFARGDRGRGGGAGWRHGAQPLRLCRRRVTGQRNLPANGRNRITVRVGMGRSYGRGVTSGARWGYYLDSLPLCVTGTGKPCQAGAG